MKTMVGMSVGVRRVSGRLLVAAASVLLSSGCASAVSDDSDEHALAAETSELKNGTRFYGTGVSRGAVGYYIWSPVWGEWQTCSGQVVSRRTILTAAHCVIRGSFDNPGTAQVSVWRPSSTSSHVPVLRGTVTTRYNPVYLETGVTAPYDVGLLIASTDLQNITSGDAGLLAKSTLTDVPMYALGFGNYADSPTAYDDVGRSGLIVPTYDSSALEYFFEATSTQPQICGGDSGGPLKSGWSGAMLVYGVASRHTGPGTYCRPVGHWAAAANNLSWLRGNISGDCLETSTLYTCW